MRRAFSLSRLVLAGFAFLLLSSCSDGPSTLTEFEGLSTGEIEPSNAIIDGSSGGTNPHFHWLYPISSSASYSGVFDATLADRVTIEVCELTGDACGAVVGTFTSTAENYWSQIRVDTRRQQYLVYWSSAQTSVGTDYRIRALLDGTLELGYADVDVVGSYEELGTVDTDQYVGLVQGGWLPITFRLEEGAGEVNAAPDVTIIAPADGEDVGPGPITLTGTAADAGEGDLSSALSWTSSVDGALGTGPTVEATLTAGEHTVVAEAQDAEGLTGTATVTFTVLENQPPTVDITSPAAGAAFVEGEDVILTATAQDPEDAVDLSAGIVWSSDPAIPGLGTGPSFTVQPDPGTYVVTASAEDGLGAEGSAAITITVAEDEAPVVTITAPSDGSTVNEGSTVSMAGVATDAVDGDLTDQLAWSSDLDGALGTGPAADAVLSVGTHVLTAAVDDSGGNTGTASVTLTVAPNDAPAIVITEPTGGTSVVEGTALTLSATATDPQDGDLSGAIQWAGDLAGPLGTGPALTVTLAVGTHVVTARVADSNGAEATASVTVTVTADEAPVVTVTSPTDGSTVQEGASVQLTAAATDAEDGDLSTQLAWTSSLDGSLGTGGSLAATLSVGTHVLTAAVNDSRGNDGSASVSVTVAANTAPNVEITAPADGITVVEGTALTFDATATDAQDGDLSGAIQWAGDSQGPLGSGASITATLPVGTHVVTASVDDSRGATGSASVTVVVTADEAPVVTIQSPPDGTTVAEGTALQLAGTATDSEDGDLSAALAWSSDVDGSLGTGASLNTTLSAGSHVVTAAVADAAGNTGAATVTVTVAANTAPTVTVTAPTDGASVVDGTTLTFSATATDPEDGDLSSAIQWTGDAVGALGTGASIDVVLPVGTHVVQASVTDGLGAAGGDLVTVTVTADEPPVIVISEPVDGITVAEASAITLAGTATDAVDGDLSAGLAWSSDLDGALGTGASIEQTLSVGTHVVTATATDSQGGTGAATVGVTVAPNTAPTLTITEPVDGAVYRPGDIISLTGTASDEEDGDLSASIQWTSDRDGALGTGSSIQPDLSGGGHRITASVTDALGASTEVGIDILVGIVGVQQVLTVPFSGTASLPVTLAEPAPAAGLTLTVTSSDPSIVEILTPTVEVAAGDRATNALVEGIAPGEATLTVSTANLGSGVSEATVTGELRLNPTSVLFTGGFGPATLSVELYSGTNPAVAPPGGLEVALAADDPACVAVPATATVSAGQGGADVELTWAGATLPCSTTVRATAPNLDPASADVQLRAPPVFQISTAIADRLADGVGSGLMLSAQGRLSVPDHGGTTLTITSPDPSLLLVSRSPTIAGVSEVTISIPDDETGFSFWVHGVEGATGEVELSLTAPGVPSSTVTARVVQPSVRLVGVPDERQIYGSDTEPSFQTGIVVDGSWRVQAPRAGTTVQATVTSSDSAVAAFDLGSGTFADTALVVARAYGDGTLNASSATLQANAIGTVTIGVSTPGFLPYQAEKQMIIRGSDIILTSGGTIGNGLMAPLSGRLSERPPEDVPVTVVSNDPDKVLVSFATTAPPGETVARDSIQSAPLDRDRFLTFTFRVHVLEDAVGNATVTVSAPGFAPATATITPDPDLEYTIGAFNSSGGGSLTRTINTLGRLTYSADIRLANGSSLGGQVVRSDHPNPPTLELTSSDVGVGGFVVPDSEELSATGIIRFEGGESRKAVGFEPDQPGTTTVSVANPTGDLDPYGATSGVITVIGTPISAADQTVGAGLMDRAYFYLSEYAPETLTATVTSSDTTVVRVGSSGFSAPGESYGDVVTAGNNRIETSLHGIREGTATLTIEAPGYETTTAQVTVVRPAVRIARGLPGTIRTFDNPNPFSFWVGHTAGSSLDLQRVRTGAGPLTVSVTSSDSDVALLQSASAPAGSGTTSITVDLPEGAYVIGEGNANAPAVVPVVNGVTEISLSAPGYDGTSRFVTVASPEIVVNTPSRVGGGLYDGGGAVRLGVPASPNHGGVTLTLESSDPSRILIGPENGSDPAGTYSVFMPDGETRLDFAVHGVQGTTATNVQVRATAQGYVDGADFVDVETPRFRVSLLSSTQTAGAGPDPFYFALETRSYEYGWVTDPAGLPVTIETSDASVLQVGVGDETGSSATATVPQGAYYLRNVLYVAPVAAGTATVTISAPGVQPYTRTITVNSP